MDVLLPLSRDSLIINSRFFRIGGMIIQVRSSFPLTGSTFHEKLLKFEVSGPGEDNLTISHYFPLPELAQAELGKKVHHQNPWVVYNRDGNWYYLLNRDVTGDPTLEQLAAFNHDHTFGNIYHASDQFFRRGGMSSISFPITDQHLTARVLPDRMGNLIHSAGMIIDGKGLLFVGHSEAGKSTTVTMLRGAGEILCDDRNIVRRYPEGWRLFGTWSHGDVPDVSPASAPLHAIFLLEQAPENQAILIDDRREIVHRLPFFVIKPLVTAGWWEKTLDIIGMLAREVPVYRLRFDRSGRMIDVLQALL